MTNEEMLNRITEIERGLTISIGELNLLKAKVNVEPQPPQENLEPKFDVPEIGQKYFLVYTNGAIDELNWGNTYTDYERLAHGNIRFTQTEALKEQQYRKLRTKYVAYVKEYNGDWVTSNDDTNGITYYTMVYNRFTGSLAVDDNNHWVTTELDFIFKDSGFLPFIQKRMTDKEIRAVINHDLSCIQLEN